MKIKITGANGYLAKAISIALKAHGHQVESIPRELLYGETSMLKEAVSGADTVIHLAGSPILTRWNKANKQKIVLSRVITTQNLAKAIGQLPPGERPGKLIQASAIGIYSAAGNHNENSADFDKGFVGRVVTRWEEASANLPDDVERVVFRIGLVIGKKAKTITNLLLPFKLGLGAKIGNGKQPFPFIHDADLSTAFLWATEKDSLRGIFNLVAPQQISNRDFTKALAKALHRPALFIIPEFVLKMILGEAAVLLTDIPGVIPENLSSAGFEFRYPDIESALKEIIV